MILERGFQHKIYIDEGKLSTVDIMLMEEYFAKTGNLLSIKVLVMMIDLWGWSMNHTINNSIVILVLANLSYSFSIQRQFP